MIDHKLIDQHPASQLAAQCLKSLKEPENSTTPLLQLTIAYLEKVLGEPNPQNYLEDVKQEAYRLMSQPAARVVELFCPDWEDLQAELEENPDQQWEILKENLDSLFQEMKEKKTVREIGSLLADNLFCSLCHLYPSFGPQNG
jgi:hypothetical protein